MNIVLIGFMGTGKSAVGKELSKLTGRDYLETDELIQQREGLSISEIFANKGEAYFRRLEKEAVKAAAQTRNSVIATGGGVVLDPENVSLLKETGILVCLSASMDSLMARLSRSKRRPLLNVPPDQLQSHMEQMLQKRQPAYACAEFYFDTSAASAEAVARQIWERISKQQEKQSHDS